MSTTAFPAELQAMKEELREYALEYGLDFFETYFELLDFDPRGKRISVSDGTEPLIDGSRSFPMWRLGSDSRSPRRPASRKAKDTPSGSVSSLP